MSTLTLAQAKSHLNITGNTHDSDLQDVIDAAEAAISERCGPLSPTTVTARIPAAGQLTLPVVPVISLTSVTPVDSSALTIGDLYLDADSGVVEHNSGSTFSARYYTVVYSAGRSEVPADLLLAVKELVRHLWETRRGSTRRPGSPASESPTANPGAAYLLPYRVAELIAPHTQVVVG